MHDDVLFFPSILYGDAQCARRAWRDVVKRVRIDGNWKVLDSLRYISVDNHPGEIILEVFDGRGISPERAAQTHWWMNWVATTRLGKAYDREEVSKDRDLVLKGLGPLWYSV